MKLTPIQDRILVERIEDEKVTSGGIIIPDNAKEKPMKGTIIAIGSGSKSPEGKLIPIELKVGQVVYFTKWSGTEIKFNGKDLLVMKEGDVIAVVE